MPPFSHQDDLSSTSTPMHCETTGKSALMQSNNSSSISKHHNIIDSNSNTIMDNVETAFTRLFAKLQANYMMETPLAAKLGLIYDGVLCVAEFAHEYNFNGLNANGYWTFLKSCYKLADLLESKLDNFNDALLVDMDNLVNGYVRMLSHILTLRDITKDDGYGMMMSDENSNQKTVRRPSKSLFVPSSEFSVDLGAEASLTHVQLTSLMSSFGAFWLCKSLKYFFELYMFGVSFFGGLFPLTLKSLWSRKYRASTFVRWIQYPSISYPFGLWDLLDYKLVCKCVVPLLFIGRGLQTKTLHIPITPNDSEFKFSKDGKDVIRRKDAKNCCRSRRDQQSTSLIKCRLLRGKNAAKGGGKLVFHCHGGGWLTHSPDSHENYLRRWAVDAPDISILSVAYSLKKRHPIPLQEILDVYLWITSGKPQVAETLGFQPKEIVFAGDSAGANLVVALTMALNDIRQKYPQDSQRIRLPSAIFSIYGAFLLSPMAGPSRVVGYIDPLLSPGVLLTCGGVYSDLTNVDLPESELSRKPSIPNWDSNLSLMVNVKKFLLATCSVVSSLASHNSKPWFKSEGKSLEQRMKILDDRMQTPYCSPLLYTKFASLDHIKMHIIASEFCPLLDESVTMAKLWKGPVEMDVVADLPHGFLNFTLFSPECERGSRLCAKRLKQLFETK